MAFPQKFAPKGEEKPVPDKGAKKMPGKFPAKMKGGKC